MHYTIHRIITVRIHSTEHCFTVRQIYHTSTAPYNWVQHPYCSWGLASFSMST